MAIKKVLMCPPTYFDIEYSINPYMDVNNKVNKEIAHQEWQFVYDTLQGLGVEIEIFEPVEGLPDMTFIGDAGMVHNGKFLATNFRHAERQGEEAHYVKWFKDHGYPVHEIPKHIFFEGLGDVVLWENDFLYGYGQRSSQEALQYVREVYPELNLCGELELKDEGMYHLGLAISFIDKDTVLYYPGAFTDESLEYLRNKYERRIECTEIDAKEYFVSNNIPIGKKIIMDNATPELESKMNEMGYEVIKASAGEFKKSGGSVRCLIIEI